MDKPRELDELATLAWSFDLDPGIINSASWSPDGALVVLNCFPNFLVVLDGKTGEEVKRLVGLEYSRSKSFWSSDASLLFSHIHYQIRVWDVATWSEVRRIELSGSTNSLAADPQGSLIATGYDVREGCYSGYGWVDVQRTADGSKVARIETKDWVCGVSLSASGQLASWSNGRAVKIWNVADKSLVHTLRIAKGMPNRAIWSPSESTMVVATTGAEIYVFDAQSGEQRFFSASHVTQGFDAMGLYALGFSSDESWFASKAGDGKVLVWRTTDWQPFAVFQPRAFDFRLKKVPLLAIRPNAAVLLTQNEDCSGLNVWDLGDWASKARSNEHEPRSTTSRPPSERRPTESHVISLGELQRLGEFTRWQEVGKRLRAAEREHGPLRNYPLFAGWSEPDSELDILDGSRWKRVVLKARDGKQLTYEHRGEVKQFEFRPNTVAPAGHFTDFDEAAFDISTGEVSTGTSLAEDGWIVVNSELVRVEWPYLTLRVKQCPASAVVASTYSEAMDTFHVADPRLIVNGVRRPRPLFNTPIAVSHRWGEIDHPDRSGAQYRELLERATALKLHPVQPFVIDYCSLPQKPWTPEEQKIFAQNLIPFHRAFTTSSIIIEHGAEDYGTRAWCMLELILIAIEGWLADGPEKLRAPPQLPHGLGKTWERAENFLKLANECTAQLGHTLVDSGPGRWNRYASDPRNLAFQRAKEKQQRKLLRLFDKELQVTDPSDRPRIKKLLQQLVFRKGTI
jgi:hypothetical protein